MDKEFILEGNRLIADYMGVEWRGKQIVIPPTNVLGEEVNMEPKIINHDETLVYHCSYCSLMPVVEKLMLDDCDFYLSYREGIHTCKVEFWLNQSANTHELIDIIWKSIVECLRDIKKHDK